MRRVIQNPIAGALVLAAGFALLAALIANPARRSYADSTWITTTVADLGYSIDRPASSAATYYPSEQILQIELAPDPVILTVRVFENPDHLASDEWADRYLLDPSLRGSSPLAPPLPTEEREELILGSTTADRFIIHGPVKTTQRTVVARGETTFLLDHERLEGAIGESLNQIVSSIRFGDFDKPEGYSPAEAGFTEDIPELPVPLYSQKDPRWICDQIGSCWCYLGNCWGHTGIGDAGCYITAESMIFDYYTGGYMNPQELDTCLTNNGGYGLWQGCGWGLCATTYNPISACKPSSVTYEGLSSSRPLLDTDLQNGYPVIAWVDGGVHYLVITGKQSGKYLVNDPLYSRTSIYSGEIIYYVRLHGPPPPEPSVDPSLESGFPAQSYESSGMQFPDSFKHALVANLDGDPQLEIASTALGNGPLYVWEADGALSAGWPQGISSGQAVLSAGKLTDASQELSLLAGYGSGEVYGYQTSGTNLPGWPLWVPAGGAPPSLADIDGDGLEDIVLPTGDGRIEAFRHDGTPLTGWPVQGPPGLNFSTPALADLDGDSDLEVVALAGPGGAGLMLYGFSHTGQALPGFPVPVAGARPTMPVVGDVDGDLMHEIIVAGAEASVQVFSSDGLLERTLQPEGPFTRTTAPALGDLDGDGRPEILLQADQSLNAWSGDGASIPGWPESWGAEYTSGGSAPVVGDVDGDGFPDVVITLQTADLSGPGQLRAYDRFAVSIPQATKTIDIGSGGVPAIADIDLDTRNEIVLLSANDPPDPGFADKLWVIDLGGQAHGQIEWGQFGGGPQHRGVYPVPLPPQPAGIPPINEGEAYLPVVRMKSNSLPATIHGKVTIDGFGAGGIPLTLRYFDGEDWMDWISLASASDGSFHFQSPPGLGPGAEYRVRFTSDSGTPGLVAQWESRPITNFHDGGRAGLSQVDLSDVTLVSPAPSASTLLPAVFSWYRSPGLTEFHYRLVIYDPIDGDPLFQGALVEDQFSYTLPSLPESFEYNESYTWSIWIYGPDGSQLLSKQAWPISFAAVKN